MKERAADIVKICHPTNHGWFTTKPTMRKLLLILVFLDYVGAEELRSQEYTPRCRDGYTVLHYAVYMNWLEGVCMCFEAEADANMKSANNGDTPLHTAASIGNLEILKEVLQHGKSNNIIYKKNVDEETAIFKSIENGHTGCVRLLLQEGALIKVTLSWLYNVFHVAAERGHVDTLEVLLDHDKKFTRKNVDVLTTDSKRFGPIHFAVENNHIECVNLLLSKNASIDLKTGNNSTLLHIAASKNNLELVKFILKSQQSQIHNVDKMGWTPLHTASCIRARNITRLLVLEGADLSTCTTGPKKNYKTAIEMIMNNISKPTEFLESIFDLCIRTNKTNSVQEANEFSFQDPDVEVKVDYSILLPKSETQNSYVKLKVIDALLDTGNSSGQKRLLIHPLVESFICLKWKALVPFFYVMLFIYSLFVLTLTTFVMIDFGYKDEDVKTRLKPSVLNTTFWTYALYTSIVMVLLQEVIFLTVNLKHYVLQIETWVKLASVILAMMLPKLMAKYEPPSTDSVDWIRHVATTAILMCWLHLIFLLSRFPKWGCYVLMFRKVLKNVLKILLTFACLVFGFALSFMIQFHHKEHFTSIWTAFVKIMVMMTSEFDYDDLVVDKQTSQIQPWAVVVFLIFLILAAIVLMNLMVGVSVNDLNDLKIHGRIMQLEKQVEIVNSICCFLETLVFKKVFMKLLPKNWLEFPNMLILNTDEPTRKSNRAIPKHVRDAIFKNAMAQEKNEDKQISFESLMQLDEFREFINDFEKFKKKLDDIHEHCDSETQLKHVDDLKVKTGIIAESDAVPKSSNQKELVINMPTSHHRIK